MAVNTAFLTVNERSAVTIQLVLLVRFSLAECSYLLRHIRPLLTLMWSFMPLTVTLFIISFSSPTLFFILGLKLSFSANPSHCSLSFSSPLTT